MVLSFMRVINSGEGKEYEPSDYGRDHINIGTMVAIDSNGQGVSYSLSSGDIENFSIDSRKGALYYLSGFDREAGDGILSIVVTAHATSGSVAPISHLIIYTALNTNDEAAEWAVGGNPTGIAIDEAHDGTGGIIRQNVAFFFATDADRKISEQKPTPQGRYIVA